VIIEALAMGTPVAAYPVPGPNDIIDQGITGSLNQDLEQAIEICLKLDRDRVQEASQRWTWEKCWKIFKHNLINKS
jgi:glycosyltransferase involved in cell wall biosynthesis